MRLSLFTGAAASRLFQPGVAEADEEDQPCLPQNARSAPLRMFRQARRDSSVTLCGSLQIERPALKEEKLWIQPDRTIQLQMMCCILAAEANLPRKKSRRPWRTTSGTIAGTSLRRQRPRRPAARRARTVNSAFGVRGRGSAGTMTLDSSGAALAAKTLPPGLERVLDDDKTS